MKVLAGHSETLHVGGHLLYIDTARMEEPIVFLTVKAELLTLTLEEATRVVRALEAACVEAATIGPKLVEDSTSRVG